MPSRQQTLNDHALLLYAFDDPNRGDKVLHKVRNQSTLAMLDIIAEASIRHDADGQVHYHMTDTGARGMLSSATDAGAQVPGASFTTFAVTSAAGAIFAGIKGRRAKKNLATAKLEQMADALPPNSSAFVILASKETIAKVPDRMKAFTDARVVHLSLTKDLHTGDLHAEVQQLLAEIQ